jgi:hypothetical protein
MPAQDRVRGDQAMATQRSGQPPHERGEHGPVRPVHARSWVGAAQDGDLVRSTRSSTSLWRTCGPSAGPAEHLQKIKYSNRSDTMGSCPTSDHRWSATQASSGTPQALPQEPRAAPHPHPRRAALSGDDDRACDDRLVGRPRRGTRPGATTDASTAMRRRSVGSAASRRGFALPVSSSAASTVAVSAPVATWAVGAVDGDDGPAPGSHGSRAGFRPEALAALDDQAAAARERVVERRSARRDAVARSARSSPPPGDPPGAGPRPLRAHRGCRSEGRPEQASSPLARITSPDDAAAMMTPRGQLWRRVPETPSPRGMSTSRATVGDRLDVHEPGVHQAVGAPAPWRPSATTRVWSSGRTSSGSAVDPRHRSGSAENVAHDGLGGRGRPRRRHPSDSSHSMSASSRRTPHPRHQAKLSYAARTILTFCSLIVSSDPGQPM